MHEASWKVNQIGLHPCQFSSATTAKQLLYTRTKFLLQLKADRGVLRPQRPKTTTAALQHEVHLFITVEVQGNRSCYLHEIELIHSLLLIMITISYSVWNPVQVGTCTTAHQPQTLMVTSHTAEVLMLSMLGDIKLIMTKRKHFSQKNKQKMPPDQSMFSYYVPLFSCILFYFAIFIFYF